MQAAEKSCTRLEPNEFALVLSEKSPIFRIYKETGDLGAGLLGVLPELCDDALETERI